MDQGESSAGGAGAASKGAGGKAVHVTVAQLSGAVVAATQHWPLFGQASTPTGLPQDRDQSRVARPALCARHSPAIFDICRQVVLGRAGLVPQISQAFTNSSYIRRYIPPVNKKAC